MKTKQSLGVVGSVLLAGMGVGSAAATASGAVIVEQPGNHRLRNDGNYSVGYVFTVNTATGENISITALGVYDAPNDDNGSVGDGLLDDTNIALREVTLDPAGADGNGRMRYLYAKDGDGNTIAPIITSTGAGSFAVPSRANAGTVVSGYRYATLDTPIILENGKMYEIVAGYNNGNDKYINYNGGDDGNSITSVVSDDFTIQTTAVYVSGGTNDNAKFSLGGDNGRVGDPYSGPNFQYTVVPEPASLALLGIGAAGLLLKRRRR